MARKNIKGIARAGKLPRRVFVPGTFQGDAERHIERLANTVRTLGKEVNPTGALFWVADFTNPADVAYNAAMIEYQEAVEAYRNGGKVGRTYRGK